MQMHFFKVRVNGSSLSISGVLASRGLLEFTVLFVPILLLGLSLFICLFKVKETSRGIGITLFISWAGSFLAVFLKDCGTTTFGVLPG